MGIKSTRKQDATSHHQPTHVSDMYSSMSDEDKRPLHPIPSGGTNYDPRFEGLGPVRRALRRVGDRFGVDR